VKEWSSNPRVLGLLPVDRAKFLGLYVPPYSSYHKVETEKFGILDEVNELLGIKWINSGFNIRHHKGIVSKQYESLKRSLSNRGFNTQDLEETLSKSGFLHRFELFDTVTKTPVNNTEVGLGLIQMIPILANMAHHSFSTIICEQPELHLHPTQQSSLAKSIINYRKINPNNFIIETHSEHFIKTVQLEVTRFTSTNGEEGIDPNDVQILYVFKDRVSESSKIREIKLKKDGSFTEPWPDDFFDASADITLERLRLTHRN
jgi:predicted ATPase